MIIPVKNMSEDQLQDMIQTDIFQEEKYNLSKATNEQINTDTMIDFLIEEKAHWNTTKQTFICYE